MMAGSRNGAWTRRVCVLLMLGALLACKKKREEPSPTPVATISPNTAKANELRPKLEARLALLATLAKKAKSEPRVRREKPFATKIGKEELLILGDKWLEDVHYKTTDSEVELDNSTLALCDYRKDKTDPDDDDVGYMEECIGWKYLAVARPRLIEIPKIKLATKSFDPGTVQGDMLLFDLSSGDIVGRYTMNITNSDELTYLEGKPEAEWTSTAKDDLVENVEGVIRERLALERDSMGK